MNVSTVDRAVWLRYQELVDAWNAARAPLRDERPEAAIWYEERQTDARDALIAFRKLHRDGVPRANWGDGLLRMLRRASAALRHREHQAPGEGRKIPTEELGANLLAGARRG
jgi:hypothetical protein